MLWIYALLWRLPYAAGIQLQLQESRVQEFCQWEMFNVSCRGPNEFILITSARYGRMQVGRCVPVDYFIGCSVDVRHQMDAVCSGRRHCTVTVSNRDLFRVQPCRKDLVAYLEAEYRCVPVSGLDSFDSRGSGPLCTGNPLVSRDKSGYFATYVTWSTGLGSERCPWLIEAKRGQRVRLTLRDLSVDEPGSAGGLSRGRSDDRCPVVVEFYEEDKVRDRVRSCVVVEEKVVSHTSTTNRLYVSVHLNNASSETRFYMHYELVGCPDVDPPLNAWLRRDGDRLLVTCNFTRERWHIVCNGQEWISAISNCSSSSGIGAVDEIKNVNNKLRQAKSFPFGLLLAVPVGIVIGIAIGFLVLLLICFCRNRLIEKRECNGVDQDQNLYKLLELRPHTDRLCRESTSLASEDRCNCPSAASAAAAAAAAIYSSPNGQAYLGDSVCWQYIGLRADRDETWHWKNSSTRSQAGTNSTEEKSPCLCSLEEGYSRRGRRSPCATRGQRCTCSSGKCIHKCATIDCSSPRLIVTPGSETRAVLPHSIATEMFSRKLQMDVDEEEEEEDERRRCVVERKIIDPFRS